MRSEAQSVQQYLDELPQERRAVISAVRDVILEHLPDGYVESMNWGMISFEIPLERYPNTYNGQPLVVLALAAQKHHYALYLMSVYADSDQESSLKEAYARAGKKLTMGKSCLRFKKFEDLELGAISEIIAATPPDELIKRYEAARRR